MSVVSGVQLLFPKACLIIILCEWIQNAVQKKVEYLAQKHFPCSFVKCNRTNTSSFLPKNGFKDMACLKRQVDKMKPHFF